MFWCLIMRGTCLYVRGTSADGPTFFFFLLIMEHVVHEELFCILHSHLKKVLPLAPASWRVPCLLQHRIFRVALPQVLTRISSGLVSGQGGQPWSSKYAIIVFIYHLGDPLHEKKFFWGDFKNQGFVDSPLGVIWTQAHMSIQEKKKEKQITECL